MANFEVAYDTTMGHEGGYVNDPTDYGGETYKGISRKYWPNWDGWRIIDNLKYKPGFPENLRNDPRLDRSVKKFYKDNFWNGFLGDVIGDQDIANEIFDTAVNMGIGKACKFLQKSLNLLNNNGKRYNDIVEDGKMGPNTLTALGEYLRQKDKSYLLKVMNLLQGNHYIKRMSDDPTQEKFAFGWMSRVEIKKNY